MNNNNARLELVLSILDEIISDQQSVPADIVNTKRNLARVIDGKNTRGHTSEEIITNATALALVARTKRPKKAREDLAREFRTLIDLVQSLDAGALAMRLAVACDYN
jgi:hypothetical protein